MRGCNLRCPYCYNTELVAPDAGAQAQDAAESGNQSKAQDAGGDDCSQAQKSGAQAKRDQPQFVSIQDIIAHLKKRANVLSGFVISGGEPLLNPDIVQSLILEARSLGYKIKLDTNGMFPDRLQELLSNPACAPDYVALDVKTAPERYSELQAQDAATIKAFQDLNAGGQNLAAQKIVESIKIVSALPAAAREFRTVLYPPLVGEKEIKEIAKLLPKDARWYFAHFLNGRCLNPEAEKIVPYDEKTEAGLVELAQAKIPGAIIR